MVGDLQEVQPLVATDAGCHQRRIDVVLDITGQQEAPLAEAEVEDERRVVDGPTDRRRPGRQRAGRWPTDIHHDAVERDSIPGREHGGPAALPLQLATVRDIARPVADHPVLGHRRDGVPLEEQRQSGNVILVRMGQHDEVDAPVPGRDALVQCRHEPIGVRTGVEQHPTAVRPIK